jgi:hypothetical protein
MKLTSATLLLSVCWLTVQPVRVASVEPVRLVFDTDIGNDVDDALAIGVIHALQSRGECELLAVTITKDHELSAPFVDALNTFYGRGNIPIGVVRNGPTPEPSPFTVLANQRDKGKLRYPHDLMSGADAPEATQLLREVLGREPDRSVVIVQVGFSVNLARLLDSPADRHSPLAGRELVQKKVRLLSLMTGAFQPIEGKTHLEYNVVKDLPSARKLAQAWPTPMIYSGFEIELAITYPAQSIERDYHYVAHHPLAEAYCLFMPPPHNRPTWDLTSVLQVVRPDRGYFGLSEPGRVVVSEEGATQFVKEAGGPHRYLIANREKELRVREVLVQLSSQPPTLRGSGKVGVEYRTDLTFRTLKDTQAKKYQTPALACRSPSQGSAAYIARSVSGRTESSDRANLSNAQFICRISVSTKCMTNYQMLSRVGGWFVLFLSCAINAACAAGPIDVGSRKQLFVDDRLIARSRGIELTMNVPVKMHQPVLANDIPWEGESGASIGFYSSVIKAGGKIRIWGSGKAMLPVRLDPDGPVTHLLAYAESTDGIHFTKPEASLVAYDEDKAEIGKHGSIGGVSVWIDPKAPPSQRYKTQAKCYSPAGRPAEFRIFCSPDGYRWTLLAKPGIGTCDTQSIIFWDDSQQRYLLYTRENPNAHTPKRRRVVRRLESTDLLRWENEIVVMDTDGVDNGTYTTPTPQPPVDYYGATVFKYPDDSPDSAYLMIAHTFWHWQRRPKEQRAGGYRDHKFEFEVLAPATLDDRLAVSRDGIQFNRLGGRKAFLPLGLAGTFSSKFAWSSPNPIRMGDELWIYYFGDNQDHDGFMDPAASKRKTAIDRAILRLDGFVSADAAYAGGEIVTPLLTFVGSKLELNVDSGAGGSIRVELLDENEKPIKGYAEADATALFENSVCLTASWGTNRSVAALAGKPVKLRLLMRDCKLYAFQFAQTP